jgi:hypothetical protein
MKIENENSDNPQNPQLNIADVSGSFYWSTNYYHHDNAFTMQDFLNNYLPADFEVIFEDGSYAEVQQHATDAIFSLNAKGNGDSFHHVVNWKFLR